MMTERADTLRELPESHVLYKQTASSPRRVHAELETIVPSCPMLSPQRRTGESSDVTIHLNMSAATAHAPSQRAEDSKASAFPAPSLTCSGSVPSHHSTSKALD